MTINQRIGSINKDNSQSNIGEFANKKIAYDEVCLYYDRVPCFLQIHRAEKNHEENPL